MKQIFFNDLHYYGAIVFGIISIIISIIILVKQFVKSIKTKQVVDYNVDIYVFKKIHIGLLFPWLLACSHVWIIILPVLLTICLFFATIHMFKCIGFFFAKIICKEKIHLSDFHPKRIDKGLSTNDELIKDIIK